MNTINGPTKLFRQDAILGRLWIGQLRINIATAYYDCSYWRNVNVDKAKVTDFNQLPVPFVLRLVSKKIKAETIPHTVIGTVYKGLLQTGCTWGANKCVYFFPRKGKFQGSITCTEKIAPSILLKLFINGDVNCHSIEVPLLAYEWNSFFICKKIE